MRDICWIYSKTSLSYLQQIFLSASDIGSVFLGLGWEFYNQGCERLCLDDFWLLASLHLISLLDY